MLPLARTSSKLSAVTFGSSNLSWGPQVLPPGADFRLLECASVDNFQGREKVGLADLGQGQVDMAPRVERLAIFQDWVPVYVTLTQTQDTQADLKGETPLLRTSAPG